MKQQSNKDQSNTLLYIAVLFTIVAVCDYIITNQFFFDYIGAEWRNGIYYNKDLGVLKYMTLFSPLMYLLSSVIEQNNPIKNKKKYLVWIIPVIITYIPIIIYYLPNKPFYNIIIIPIFYMSNILFMLVFANYFKRVARDISTDLWENISNEKDNDMSFTYDVTTEKGVAKHLTITHPVQGIYIQGGAGSGKSASLFEPILFQAVNKGYGGFIYDFKGSESPLSRSL